MTNAEYWFEEGCYILEHLNCAKDSAVSVARARVPVGGQTRWHKLRGIRERYILLEGRGVVEIGHAPARAVGPGEVVQIAPGQRQRIRNTGPTDLVFLAVCTPRFDPACYEDCDT
ncbi:MAG: cupin domain-containing protein [Abyssibacter sp.]|uniref:cupin domain-containing protein n=1 Tax=Abyssibacter sp. TaxID=2320200 RepID=UPI00321980DF